MPKKASAKGAKTKIKDLKPEKDVKAGATAKLRKL